MYTNSFGYFVICQQFKISEVHLFQPWAIIFEQYCTSLEFHHNLQSVNKIVAKVAVQHSKFLTAVNSYQMAASY